MKTNIIITTLALITAPAFADSLKSREIRLDDCPPAVRETILDNARNGTIEEVEHIRFGDQVLYVAEVDLPQPGHHLRLQTTLAGQRSQRLPHAQHGAGIDRVDALLPEPLAYPLRLPLAAR